jgi:hypothetical protein
MKKKILKRVMVFVFVFTMISGTTIYAKQIGKFTITEMNYRIVGSTNYSLANKKTTVKAKSNTYKYSNNKTTTAQGYKISLHKKSAWIQSYKSLGKADGQERTVDYGKLGKGTYRVDLLVSDAQVPGTVSWYIKGGGTIN